MPVDVPANGTLTLDPDGSFTYSPNANFNGPDSFTYHATMMAREKTTRPRSRSPSMRSTMYHRSPRRPMKRCAPTGAFTPRRGHHDLGRLANESSQKLTVDIPGKGYQHAPFSTVPQIAPDGTLGFTPEANDNGCDSFTAVLPRRRPPTGGVTISVARDLRAHPHAGQRCRGGDRRQGEDRQRMAPPPARSSLSVRDPDRDAFSVSSYTQPSHGRRSQNADGTLKYTPAKTTTAAIPSP